MWRGWFKRLGHLRSAADPGDPSLLASIARLDAGLVPHRTFPLRRWFYATPLWFYHALSPRHRLRTDAQFFSLVDPALRELCAALLDAGLVTTPSCQGHFFAKRRFERVWRQLGCEADAIRSTGLVVRDSETGEPCQYRDAAYELPWAGFDDFHAAVSRHQNRGYLGFGVPAECPAVVARLLADGYHREAARIAIDHELSRTFERAIFGVSVDPATPRQRDKAWRLVTAYMRKTLADCRGVKSVA